jgi:DNA polymerase-3 subunit alpha
MKDLRFRPSKMINRKTLESLVHSGSFDEFGEDRAVLLASLDVAIEHAQLIRPSDSNQYDLFAEEEFFPKPKYVQVDPIPQVEKLSSEKNALGIYLSNHPVSIFEKKLKETGAQQLIDLSITQKWGRAGVYIASIKKIRTKNGELMAFLTVNDSSGELEAVVFPNVYKKYPLLLDQGKMVLMEGKLEERSGKLQFIIQKVSALDSVLLEDGEHKKQAVLYLRLEEGKQNPLILKELNQLFMENKGEIDIVLYYEGSNKTIKLPRASNVTGTVELLEKLKKLLGFRNVILQD